MYMYMKKALTKSLIYILANEEEKARLAKRKRKDQTPPQYLVMNSIKSTQDLDETLKCYCENIKT